MLSTREDVAGVVLAGGLARRMGGGDKGLITLDGKPVLDHVLDRLRPQTAHIALNANGPTDRFSGYGLPVICDTVAGFAGPLAGVLAGLEWASASVPEAKWIVTVATDTPFFPRNLVQAFVDTADRESSDLVCAASADRHHPVFGLWPVSLTGDLRAALVEEGVRKVDVWTARHRLAVASFPVADHDPFFNANRPEDMARAHEIARKLSLHR